MSHPETIHRSPDVGRPRAHPPLGAPPVESGATPGHPGLSEAGAPRAERAERADIAWVAGMAAGCARGLVAGRRRALHAVLSARFGPLDESDTRRLRRIDPAALDRCLRDAARAPDLDAFWRDPRPVSGARA